MALIATVVVSSFAARWLGTWLPAGFTANWFASAWEEFHLLQVLTVTLQVSLLVVLISVLVGVPAAYVLARRKFPGRQALYLIFLLPILMPPITYGIPLATVLYKNGFAGHLSGVVLGQPGAIGAVRDPDDDPVHRTRSTPPPSNWRPGCAGRERGRCSSGRPCCRSPACSPPSILVLVRTVGMFELTSDRRAADPQTLVVALYASMSAAAIAPSSPSTRWP